MNQSLKAPVSLHSLHNEPTWHGGFCNLDLSVKCCNEMGLSTALPKSSEEVSVLHVFKEHIMLSCQSRSTAKCGMVSAAGVFLKETTFYSQRMG